MAIVEGHAEVRSIGVLARRVSPDVHVLRPLRVKRQQIVRPGELERSVELAARKLGSAPGGILVLLDAETDCPAKLGPDLLERARRQRANTDARVVLATREFEAWFIAGLESLRGTRGVAADAAPPDDPEAITSPKSWLARLMSRRYEEVIDQPAFAATFDYEQARHRSPSLDKLLRELADLL